MNLRTLSLRSLLLAGAVVLLVVSPAGAHPFFQDGGEAPVDSLASLTLDLAHGCDSEEAGAGADTTEVALEVPDWMRVVDVPEPDGWSVELDGPAGDARVDVVTWTTEDPQVPAPTFDLDVVVQGEVGEVRYVGVFQACGETSYRWVGTPDEPADDPAVRLTLVEADPDAPPPPEPDPAETETDAAEPEPDDATEEDPDVAEPEPDPTEPEPGATEPEPDDATAQPEAEADGTDDPEMAAADDDGGGGLPWMVGIVVLLAAAAAAAVGLRRRGASAPEPRP